MKRFTPRGPLACLALAALLLWTAGCDNDITGSAFENQPPDTRLSVRDTSLVDNIDDADRLASTVALSWSGTDPDGFVSAYELRYWTPDQMLAPDEGWTRTTRTDSLVLLPIPRGERVANVTVEVRAIDNEGLTDPDPARTVFPIQNAPPSIQFERATLPPDTTFSVVSIGWRADDPEGEANLDRIEISLNDSTSFTALPPDVDFVTLVGQVDRDDPMQTETTARVYLGQAFQTSTFEVGGLRLDADNTLYLRVADQTDTTSTLQRFTWYVKKPTGRVLYVNDYRKSTWPTVQAFHLDLLRETMPAGEAVDVWNLSEPYVTGSAGNAPRSDALPSVADPMISQTLALYEHVYWVSTNTTNSIQGNNLPLVAGVTDAFFEGGGTMMVHTPVSLPADPEDNLGNPAVVLLPLSDLITFPDTLRQTLRIAPGAMVSPKNALPGVSEPLPALQARGFIINTLPFVAEGSSIIPLYGADYTYLPRQGSEGPWSAVSDQNTVASITADGTVGLFALPLVSEISGAPAFQSPDGDLDAGRRAVQLMLQALDFPQR